MTGFHEIRDQGKRPFPALRFASCGLRAFLHPTKKGRSIERPFFLPESNPTSRPDWPERPQGCRQAGWLQASFALPQRVSAALPAASSGFPRIASDRSSDRHTPSRILPPAPPPSAPPPFILFPP